MIGEPILEASDIQGHIAPGFPEQHQTLLGFRFRQLPNNQGFGEQQEARAALGRLMQTITTLKALHTRREGRLGVTPEQGCVDDDDGTVSTALCLSAGGLAALGHSPSAVEDSAFSEGMWRDAHSFHDPVDKVSGAPVGWTMGASEEETPHFVLIISSDSIDEIIKAEEKIENILNNCVEQVLKEKGKRLPRDFEHFGFKDNISTMALRGRIDECTYFEPRSSDPVGGESQTFARPGRPLVYPGSFIFGYPAQGACPTKAGPNYRVASWLRNGSLLVVRKLEQDVAKFKSALTHMVNQINGRFASLAGIDAQMNEAKLSAMIVGRWPNGTPLISSKNGAENFGDDVLRNNNFSYSGNRAWNGMPTGDYQENSALWKGDPLGAICPAFSHIRKINPRDLPTDFNDPVGTLARQVIRRGIPYEEENGSVGLLFMCYQASIRDQFSFLMRNWINSDISPHAGGHDMLIGQSAAPDNERTFGITINDRYEEFSIKGRWVTPRGGGYFLTPGLKGLRYLLRERSDRP